MGIQLTGLDPNSPLPGTFRELIFGAGPSNSSGKSRDVLIIANGTSAGTESTNPNVLGDAIIDDADAINRFGRRSEWYNMYKKYVQVDPAATIYGIFVPEAGTPASCTFTFTNSATATTTVEITLAGEIVYSTINNGDNVTTIAAAVSAAINAAAEGTWMVTSSPAAGVVTVTAANTGPRGDLLIGNSSTRGMRMRILSPTSVVATTVAKSALTAGATPDDFTAAYAAMMASEIYYQVSPQHTVPGGPAGIGPTYAITPTDSGIGEHVDNIKTAALPVNGKSMCAIFGLVSTQANATLVAQDTDVNSVRAFFFHQKNSDWTPGMLAAHHAAVMRSQQIVHPGANINGYTNGDAKVYKVPDAYVKTDRLTATEQTADLNSGICPIASTSRGSTYLVRHVTSRSLNAQNNADYRAREGHVTSVVDFAWDSIKARWESQKQPFVANDVPLGGKPLPNTSTPSQLRNIIFTAIDDLAGPAPLGLYTGPILSPSAVPQMKANLTVQKGNGSLMASCDLLAVEHLIKCLMKVNEVSPPQ